MNLSIYLLYWDRNKYVCMYVCMVNSYKCLYSNPTSGLWIMELIMIVVGQVSGRWSLGWLGEAMPRAPTRPGSHPYLFPAQAHAEDNQIPTAYQTGNRFDMNSLYWMCIISSLSHYCIFGLIRKVELVSNLTCIVMCKLDKWMEFGGGKNGMKQKHLFL